jgi:hypothetical protein
MSATRRWLTAWAIGLTVVGCSSSAASPAPSPVAPSPVASASGVAPSPSAAPALVTVFLERLRDPAARYRLDQTVDVVVGQATTSATSHSDVSGADRLVVTDRTVGGETTHSEYLQADGEAYQRLGEEDWRSVGQAQALAVPFSFLKASNLHSTGRQVQAGEFLEAFSLAQVIPIGEGVAESLGVAGGTANVVLFDCFLLGDGSPVRVQVGLQLSAADGSDAGYSTIEQDYSEFGGDIVVDPPIG